MSDSDFSFDKIDFSSIIKKDINNLDELSKSTDETLEEIKYDKTTNETYRIRRLFRVDPFTDQEIPTNLVFEFAQVWNPYTGLKKKIDPIGPLCFNAINLYNYYYVNRHKGLWNPPTEQYQGYYGDFVGTSKSIKIKSRGANPERYLFRLPIIDCYLPPNHKFSTITMGPELTDDEISQIDLMMLKSNHKKSVDNLTTSLTSLTTIKYYYDNALNPSPDPNCDEIIELKKKYPNLNGGEINEKYNRYWVDKLVKLK